MQKISDFRKRLKELLSGDISASDLASGIGMSKQAISSYTTGVRIPKRPVIHAIAEFLNVNPAWLMGYDAPMRLQGQAGPEENFLNALSASETTLIKKYRRLSEDSRGTIAALVDIEYEKTLRSSLNGET